MVHGDHNKNKSGGFFLIILGALLFITSPLYLADSPLLGGVAILFGFLVGCLGFYLNFVRHRGKMQ
ncbi:MAG: putative membrane protein [Cenarchaeum symbiont of Oopsacas minuta]|nr:putative membrane protein [Cenarchaeum symbiont of Oopsacas minuta]